jgi:hypothetical protein
MASTLETPRRNTSHYWACQFPRLSASGDGPKWPMSLRVNIEHLQQLQQLSGSDEAALPSLLRVAWGLLLQCYTGLDDVCFGYQETGPGTVGQESPRTSGPLNEMHAVRFNVDYMMSVADTLEKAKGEYISVFSCLNSVPSGTTKDSRSSERQLFDTAVVLRNLSNSVAPNSTGIISQPLNMVSLEDVGTRVSPLPALYADRCDSTRYAC